MAEPHAVFKIEHWYHALAALGAAGVISALAFEFPGVANAHVLLVSLGGFFVGLGEWINHPLQTAILPRSAYHSGGIITGHPRNARALGNLFDVFGFVLVAFGAYKIAAAA